MSIKYSKIRKIIINNEEWVNISDLKIALNDDELILHAAAMLKVSKIEKHDDAIMVIRKTIAYFLMNAIGEV